MALCVSYATSTFFSAMGVEALVRTTNNQMGGLQSIDIQGTGLNLAKGNEDGSWNMGDIHIELYRVEDVAILPRSLS